MIIDDDRCSVLEKWSENRSFLVKEEAGGGHKMQASSIVRNENQMGVLYIDFISF